MAAHFTVPTVSQQKQTFMKDKWHVRYNEAFTEDLYNQLMAWCTPQIRVGGLSWRNYHKGEPYSVFKQKGWGHFIFGGPTRWVGVDNNSQGNPEISIAELLQIIDWKTPTKELTSLPEKWCIKITDQNKYSIEDFFRTTIAKEYRGYTSTWRLEAGATLHYPQTSMGWGNENGSIDPGYTEITFDQFKKWVLGNPRKEDLLAEAKKRFPLGTTFYPVSASTAAVSKEVGTGTVKSELDIKWLGEEIINGSNGYLYSRGTWAEIVSCNTVAPTPNKAHKTESLLEEAKRRYPVGTKYHIAHLSADGKTTAIVRNPNAFFLHDGNVYESHGNYGANGHSYGEILYYRNNEKWAEIISRPEERSSIYWECIQPSYYNPPAFKLGTVYKQKGELTGFDTIDFEEDSLGSKTNGWSKEFFKPSTKEAYDAQFKKQEDFGTISSGLLSPDVGPIWNKGLRDYPSCYSGAGVAMLGGIGGALSGGKPFWQDLPDFEVRTEELNPMEVYKRYGLYIHKSPPEMKPSSKVSVKTEKEINIKVNKPKQINLWQK